MPKKNPVYSRRQSELLEEWCRRAF